MTVNELPLPSRFCPFEDKTLDSLWVTLGRNPKELAKKRSVPRRVLAYVFVEGTINPREAKKGGDVEVGCDVSERFFGEVKEGCCTLWERRRDVGLVTVSMLGSLKGGGFRGLFLIECFSGDFRVLIEHKLGGSEKHEVRSSTR